jgi:hypothetical protein
MKTSLVGKQNYHLCRPSGVSTCDVIFTQSRRRSEIELPVLTSRVETVPGLLRVTS